MPYVPQLTRPAQDDPYYIRKSYGGYSPCVPGSPEWFPGSALANCVGYCWGRSAYLEQNPNCNIGFTNTTTWPVNAWDWIRYPHGRTISLTVPQLGAVACWIRNDGKSGHVATVEVIDSAGNCRCSESGYGLTTIFRTKLYYNDGTGGLEKSGFTFQGYIYLNFPDGPPPGPDPIPSTDVIYPIAVGDEYVPGSRVIICAPGRAFPDGQGGIAYGIGWQRYIQEVLNGEQRPFKVGRLNGGTTGYYTEQALKLIETPALKVGDKVKIDHAGNSKPTGKGVTCYGIGWKRQILSVRKGAKYPYRLGKDGKTTGYYRACDFTKLQ